MAVLASVVTVVLVLFLVVTLIAAAAFYSHVNKKSPIDAVALPLAPSPKLEGVYAHNTFLQSASKLGTGKLLQPEDIAADPSGKLLYVSTSDGWVKRVHLSDNSVEDWKHVGGRPLGLAVGASGEVIVCESSQGLLKLTEDNIEILATEVDGTKLKFVNAAAIANDGLIYFTDSSTKFTLENFWFENFEGRPNGRIVVYNPREKSTRVLLKDLYLPNGIAISRCQQFLIFAETTAARIVKYHLHGDKEGQTEIINENLPGFPDNVHYNDKGSVLYVGVIGERDVLVDLLWKLPFVKKVLVLYPFIRAAFDKSPKKGRVVVMDESGKVVKVYEDPAGKVVGFVTVGVEVDGWVYVGGLRDDFIGRVKV